MRSLIWKINGPRMDGEMSIGVFFMFSDVIMMIEVIRSVLVRIRIGERELQKSEILQQSVYLVDRLIVGSTG